MGNFENAKVQVKQGWLQGYTEGNLKILRAFPMRRLPWASCVSAIPRIRAAGAVSARPPSTQQHPSSM